MNRDFLETSIVRFSRAYELAEQAPTVAHASRIMEHAFRGIIALYEASKWQPVGTAKLPVGDVFCTDGARVWVGPWPNPGLSVTHVQRLPTPPAKKES